MSNRFSKLEKLIHEQNQGLLNDENNRRLEVEENKRKRTTRERNFQVSISQYKPVISSLLQEFGKTVWGNGKFEISDVANRNEWSIHGQTTKVSEYASSSRHAQARIGAQSHTYVIRPHANENGEIDYFLVGIIKIRQTRQWGEYVDESYLAGKKTGLSENEIAEVLIQAYEKGDSFPADD